MIWLSTLQKVYKLVTHTGPRLATGDETGGISVLCGHRWLVVKLRRASSNQRALRLTQLSGLYVILEEAFMNELPSPR